MIQFKLRSIFAFVSAISVVLALFFQLPAIVGRYGEMLIVGACALVLFGDRLPQIGRVIWRSWHEDPNGSLLALAFGAAALSLYVGILFLIFGQ